MVKQQQRSVVSNMIFSCTREMTRLTYMYMFKCSSHLCVQMMYWLRYSFSYVSNLN